jgi:hypothetical protein
MEDLHFRMPKASTDDTAEKLFADVQSPTCKYRWSGADNVDQTFFHAFDSVLLGRVGFGQETLKLAEIEKIVADGGTYAKCYPAAELRARMDWWNKTGFINPMEKQILQQVKTRGAIRGLAVGVAAAGAEYLIDKQFFPEATFSTKAAAADLLGSTLIAIGPGNLYMKAACMVGAHIATRLYDSWDT